MFSVIIAGNFEVKGKCISRKMHITFLSANFLGNTFHTDEHQCRKADRILCKTVHQMGPSKANLKASNVCRKITPNQISLKSI
jgi:hypothetical protein